MQQHSLKERESTPKGNIEESAAQQEYMILSVDALVRSVGVKKGTPHALFLGAGASVSSGISSAEACIWEWKRDLFLTNNPGLEEQFSEVSLPSVRARIQQWLDRQGKYPSDGNAEEYSFYIRNCFPIADDRRVYFEEKVRAAKPHIGYHLLCHLAQADVIRSVWSTNFDGLAARAAASFALTPLEVGIDSQQRVVRQVSRGELLSVSLHGDYRYDALKNNASELQEQEEILRDALVAELGQTPLIVCGYSGRDQSIMDALHAACGKPGAGTLYWCGYSDGDIPDAVRTLLTHARAHGRQAFYIPVSGFDDLMTRLALHCLQGEQRDDATAGIAELTPKNLLDRKPFEVGSCQSHTIIKSNAFEIDCPSEVLSFDMHTWPEQGAWQFLREATGQRPLVAVPFKGKVLALGTIEEAKDAFGNNLKGPVERVPVAPDELRYEDGIIVRLMREALVNALAEARGIASDGRSELWLDTPLKKVRHGDVQCQAYESVLIFLRRIGQTQYLVLKPSIKVLDIEGNDVPFEVAGPVKLGILGYQHNKPFNQAVNKWRGLLFPKDSSTTFEFPANVGSTFKFRIRRSPVFGQIGLPQGGRSARIPSKLQPLLKHQGLELQEPALLVCDKNGTGTTKDTHPIRGITNNRPYDFPLTLRGLSPSIRVGVICANRETQTLSTYLQNAQTLQQPARSEQDYLIDFPGFQRAFGLPIEFPSPGSAGWIGCPEPVGDDNRTATLSTAQHITNAIETLRSSHAPHVVLIFYPTRWDHLRGYRDEHERFDVHDFVKAYAVQRGVATQFLTQDTLSDQQQCRVWWWLSLALYVKAMRTPWVLDDIDENTAYVGLGFSIDRTAEKGNQVVLGCSHIYNARGEGLQYRLSKVENPIIRRGNPFMSQDDARRVGETIRQLFYETRFKLPDRVVLHKRTPFLKDERQGLLDGLGGVAALDMLEIQQDSALRYVASVAGRDGKIDEDNYPVRRGTVMKMDDYAALLWVHGATAAVNPRFKYFQGKRRIPTPLTLRRYAGQTPLDQLSAEILGLSKMNWNTFDLYTKMPATLQSSGEIARIGSLLQRFGAASYDYRLFI